ncbi:MAG: (d)CMP kinase [Syntrophorhabdaceae bacterium]
MTGNKNKIITIDGPSGAGKSTIAKLLAARTGYTYIDSGAIYRAIAYAFKAQRNNEPIEAVLAALSLSFDFGENTHVMLSGKDISRQIREPDISLLASSLSQKPAVRDYANAVQRDLARGMNAVLEGRDTGSVVFPDADIKFYLDARPDERAARRYTELRAKGPEVRLDQVQQEMKVRDENDSRRAIAPLVIPAGAIVVDTTGKGIDGVLGILLDHIRKKDGNAS